MRAFSRRTLLLFSPSSSSSSSFSPISLKVYRFSAYPLKSREEQSKNVSVSVWWDFENCGVPDGVNVFKLAHNISAAVRANGIKGSIHITAFGDVMKLPGPHQTALSATGINFTHIPQATRHQGQDVAYCRALVRQLSEKRNWTAAPLDHGIQFVAMHQKCLFSSSSTTVSSDNATSKDSVTLDPASPNSSSPKDSSTLNPENSASKGSEEGNSGSGDKSGGSNESSDAGKPVRGGPVSWLSFLFLIITGAGLVFYYDNLKKKRIEEINKATKAVMHGPSVGAAAIGGPFNLINHEGKNVTDQDFLGKWTLIYFGFTHCPDICPDELIKLAAAIDKIKEKAGYEIVPVFISVDPERDTVEQVREYIKEFHPKLIGLTGKPEDIRSVARAYRVYYMKTEEEDSDYLVDHSIVMYLMGPDMKFVKFFGKNNDVDELTNGIIKEIKNYKP